jgi:hypothetical protein
MDLALILGVASGLIQIGGYVVYGQTALKDENEPNAGSWAMWAFGSLVSAGSYFQMTNGDLAKNILPIACCLSCVALFGLCKLKNKIRKLERFDVWMFAVDVTITTFWIFSSDPITSNLLFQASTFISFLPIIKTANKDNEKPLAWWLWSAAYALEVIVVGLHWEKWQDVVYPALCLLLDIWVAILATRR